MDSKPTREELMATIEEQRKALELVVKYGARYITCDGYVDWLIERENECWDETRIPPPGRSVSPHMPCPSDDERRDNFRNWMHRNANEALDSARAALSNATVQQVAEEIRELRADKGLLDWLEEQIVDVIYLDDGRMVDVRGNSVRKAIAARSKEDSK
jgi:hypothetical protein